MAEKQSEKSPLRSFFGGGWISYSQYLAEIMCARQAKTKGKDLPDKFWSMPEYERTYLMQIRFANQLLKLYNGEVIVKVIRSSDGRSIYSLNAKWLDGLLKAEQNKFDRQKQVLENKAKEAIVEEKSEPANTSTETFVGQKSKLSQLKDL